MSEVGEDSCCICLKGIDASGLGRQLLPCGHVLHESCIVEMRRRGVSALCPLCRQPSEDLTPVEVLVERAVALYLRGSLVESARVASEALDLQPDNIDADRLMAELSGQSKAASQEDEQAFELCEEARNRVQSRSRFGAFMRSALGILYGREKQKQSDGPHVVLLKFSRCPNSLGELLLECPELGPWREALEARGYPVTLDSGAKMLVRAEHYQAARDALHGMKLFHAHAVVDPELQGAVTDLVKTLRKREKVQLKTSTVIPIGFLLAAAETHQESFVSNTFIDMRDPAANGGGARVASCPT